MARCPGAARPLRRFNPEHADLRTRSTGDDTRVGHVKGAGDYFTAVPLLDEQHLLQRPSAPARTVPSTRRDGARVTNRLPSAAERLRACSDTYLYRDVYWERAGFQSVRVSGL